MYADLNPAGSGATIRLMQAGGSPIIRRGIAGILYHVADIDVVGEATEATGGLRRAVACLTPDVLLLHVRQADGDKPVSEWLPGLPEHLHPSVLMMTPPGHDVGVWRVVRAGVDGVIDKDDRPEELVKAIRCLAAGKVWLPPPFAQELVDHYRRNTVERPDVLPQACLLSRREHGVARLVALGHSNAEIAATLCLAESTVKTHVSRILRKLGLRDRTQLAHFAHVAHLV